MVHLYKNNGYNMVLDVNSGSIHVVDDVVYDVLELLNEAEDRSQGRRIPAGDYRQDACQIRRGYHSRRYERCI